MANIKTWWYKLVASKLLADHELLSKCKDHTQYLLDRQLRVTQEHVEKWVTSEKRIKSLESRLEDAHQALANQDAAIVREGVQMAFGGNKQTLGQLDILRQQLKQELAYVAYLEENTKENMVPFNDLPVETRKQYFERIEGQVR